MAVLNKYKRWNQHIKINEENILDFVISQDDSPAIAIDGDLTTKCLISQIDTDINECVPSGSSLVSTTAYTYDDAVNSGVTLDDIGLTAIDNGPIEFDKDTITDEEYESILFDSVMELDDDDYRLVLDKAGGNTKRFIYPTKLRKYYADTAHTYSYLTLKGGFYQGFYKLDGFNYDVLPNKIDKTWHFEFVIRPKNYTCEPNTVNELYPENKGIFFYMGTRAENKFAQFYDDALSGYPRHSTAVTHTDDDIVNTSDGYPFYTNRFYHFDTDNKHLFFNRTGHGETTNTWTGDTYQITGMTQSRGPNQYLIYNRTASGYTTSTIKDTKIYDKEEYNIIDDLVENAFALKVNDDGSIGYRYLIRDCSKEEKWSVAEEYSKAGIVTTNRWNVINVMFAIQNGYSDSCGNPSDDRRMRIYIYVNGYLKLVSRELPEFDFKRLNDDVTKQEGVPYNISLGGGTLGLLESMWEDRQQIFPYILPLEKHFCGTFIGDIRSFKMYDCGLQYNEIKNNYIYERDRIPEQPYLSGICLCFDTLNKDYEEFIENVLTIKDYLDTQTALTTYDSIDFIGKDVVKRITMRNTPEYEELYYILGQSRINPDKEFTYNGLDYEHLKHGEHGKLPYWEYKYKELCESCRFSTIFLMPTDERRLTSIKVGKYFATDMFPTDKLTIDKTTFEGYTVYRYESSRDYIRNMLDKAYTYIISIQENTPKPVLDGLYLCFNVLDNDYDNFMNNVMTKKDFLETQEDLTTHTYLDTTGSGISKSVVMKSTKEFEELKYIYDQASINPTKDIEYTGPDYKYIKSGDKGNLTYWKSKYDSFRSDSKYSTVFLMPTDKRELTSIKIGTNFATEMLNSKNLTIDKRTFEGYTIYRYKSNRDYYRSMLDKASTYIIGINAKA